MLDGAPYEPNQHGPAAVEITLIEQIARLQSYLGQHRFRNITTPSLEIMRDVFHDIRQLQPFPEAHADLGHVTEIPRRKRRPKGAHQIGPEFPDTTGDVIGVTIQFIHRFQRGEIVGRFPGEDSQIHFHPLHERSHEPLDAATIVGGKALQELETILQSLEQLAFGRILLQGSNGLLDIPDLRPGNLIAHELGLELVEIIQTPRTIDQFRVGDGIGGTREEIREADLISHISWHDDQRRIEQPGDSLEEVAEEGLLRNVYTRGRTYYI